MFVSDKFVTVWEVKRAMQFTVNFSVVDKETSANIKIPDFNGNVALSLVKTLCFHGDDCLNEATENGSCKIKRECDEIV